jgi:1,4-dihydroxy-2-naphthoate octaprenyltransferase
MTGNASAKVWAAQVRAPFLLLAVMLVLIGGAAAHQDGVFDALRFALAMLGTILAHASVNLWNELSDYRTKIDEHTPRTPFSGGSGNLQAGLTSPGAVRAAAAGTLLVALGCGLYLTWVSGPWLLVFVVAGGVAAVFYTSHMARFALGELAAGTCLGTFVVLGTYYSMAGGLTWNVVWLSIPPGILTALLLLLNEFPDAEADRAGGRRHLVIVLGRRGAAVLYTVSLATAYAIVGAGAILGWFPPWVLLSFLTLPLAIRAAIGALRDGTGSDRSRLVPAQAANVGVVLLTDLLLAVGYFVA